MERIKQRFIWLDWMKVIGMYFIICGHLWVPYYLQIYTFSVPAFFIISGFLHKEYAEGSFLMRTFRNLILPMFILTIPEILWDISWEIKNGTFERSFLLSRISNILLGYEGFDRYGGGLGNLWFVYTLSIIKVIVHYTKITGIRYLLLLIFLLFSFYLNYIDFDVYNSWINVFLAYPFYLIGIELSKKSFTLDRGANRFLMVCLFVICLVAIFLCGKYNGMVLMFNNGYGHSLVLFFIGAILGTYALYVFCWFLGSYDLYFIKVLSVGNIITLGLHYIIRIIYQNLPLFSQPSHWGYLCAFITLITFIPIIIMSKRYFPFLLGRSRVNNL